MLTSVELETAKSKITEDVKLESLLQLRENTRNFLIQCLADREIQKLIHQDERLCQAYRYNCAVIHAPHAWSHFNAVSGHGWNSTRNQPYDPKLKIGRVLSQQYSKRKPNDIFEGNNSHEAKEQQIRQLEETILILKEENATIKEIYMERLKPTPTNIHNNTKANSQQLCSLQQEIRQMKLVIESNTQTIRQINNENVRLRSELNTRRSEIENLNGQLLQQSRLASSYPLPSTYTAPRDEFTQGCCCIIM